MRSLIQTQDSLITGPTLEPLDLEEVKKDLKFTATSEDTLIDMWISSARVHVEGETGRQLITATWELWLSGFPDIGIIELPHPPLQSVVSVTYGGAELAADQYVVVPPRGPLCRCGSVHLISGASWPTYTAQAQAIKVRYVAGYGDTPSAVPEDIRHALFALVSTQFRWRETLSDKAASEVPGVPGILRRYRQATYPVFGFPMTTVADV